MSYISCVDYGKQYQKPNFTTSPQATHSLVQGLTRVGASSRRAVGSPPGSPWGRRSRRNQPRSWCAFITIWKYWGTVAWEMPAPARRSKSNASKSWRVTASTIRGCSNREWTPGNKPIVNGITAAWAVSATGVVPKAPLRRGDCNYHNEEDENNWAQNTIAITRYELKRVRGLAHVLELCHRTLPAEQA